MNQEQFEKHLRSQIAPQKTAIDTDDLWQHIEPSLPPEKKKRRFFFWLIFPVLGIIGLGYWGISTQEKPLAMQAALQPNESTDTKETNDFFNKNKPQQAEIRTLATSNNQGATENKSYKKDKLDLRETNKNETLTSPKIARKTAQGINTTAHLFENSISKIVNTKRENAVTNFPFGEVETIPTPLTDNITDNITDNVSNEIDFPNPLEWQILPLVWDLLEDATPDWRVKESLLDSTRLVSAYNKRPQLIVGLGGGVALPVRRLSETSENSIFTDYITERLMVEQVQLSSSYQASIRLQYPKHQFYLKSGLQWSQINTVFEQMQENSAENWNPEGISSIVVAQGDSTVFRHGNWETTVTTRHLKNYNSFRLLDIPLMVGKEMALAKKWSLELEAGIGLNLFLKKKGYYLRYTNTEEYGVYNDSFYKSRLDLSYLAAAKSVYQLSSKLRAQIGVQYTGYLSDFIRTDVQIEDKYTLFGLNVGLQYRL